MGGMGSFGAPANVLCQTDRQAVFSSNRVKYFPPPTQAVSESDLVTNRAMRDAYVSLLLVYVCSDVVYISYLVRAK